MRTRFAPFAPFTALLLALLIAGCGVVPAKGAYHNAKAVRNGFA